MSNKLITKIDATAYKSLLKLNPYRHAWAVICDWLIIACVMYAYLHFSTPWLYPLAVIIIGARMHALTILMHDATHFRFLKNRKWNDLISNLTIMYPIFTSIEKYRTNHLKHHRHLNTDHDPDWVAKLTKREFQFPKTKSAFLFTICSYLLLYQGVLDAVWFVKRYRGKEEKRKTQSTINPWQIGFYLVLFILLTVSGAWKWYVLFWIVPYLTSFFMFQYIRSVAEHFGELAYEDDLSSSRTVKATLFEKFFIAPHCVGYHLEHHLYPGVPFYHLPKLHQLLMKQRKYQERAHITEGYLTGLFQELGRIG